MSEPTVSIRVLDRRLAEPCMFGSVLVGWDESLLAVGPDGSNSLPAECGAFAARFPERYEVLGAVARGAEKALRPLAPGEKPSGEPGTIADPAAYEAAKAAGTITEIPPGDPRATAGVSPSPVPAGSFEDRFKMAIEAICRNKQRAAVRVRAVADALSVRGAGSSVGDLKDALRAAFEQQDLAGQERFALAAEAEAARGGGGAA